MKSILYLSLLSQLACRLVLAGSAYTSRQATFIQPASPIVTRATRTKDPEALSFARSQMIAGGYGLYPTTTTSSASSTQLFAKKKAAPAATKKIQVKLLKHVAGVGQAGEVVNVMPAYFNNKLLPQKAAKIISDEEVAEEATEQQLKEEAERAKAEELKEKLDDFELKLVRKAGPEGHLFGGIGPKVIMSELEAEFGGEFLSQKWVKITEILDQDGKTMRGDIKEVGKFGSTISLLKDISAKFEITVEAE